MANRHPYNRRSNKWGRHRWLIRLMAGFWMVGCFHIPAMDQGAQAATPFLALSIEKKQIATDITSKNPFSQSLHSTLHDPDAVVVSRIWVWAALSLLLIAGAVITWMARLMLRRKQDTVALAYNDCQIKQITERIGDVFWVGAADFSRLEYVNIAYETIWGHPREGLYKAPMSWTDSIFPHDRQAVMDVIAQMQSTGSAAGGIPDFRIVCADGTIRWIHARIFDLDGSDTAKQRMMMIFRDITRDKFFEASLRESDEKWRSMTENSPDHIMLVDLDGHIFFANRAFMGLNATELAGKSLPGLIDSEFEPAAKVCLQKVVESGQSKTCQVECDWPGEGPFIFEMRMGPVTVNDKIVAVAVNSTEITNRVQQENALKESEAFHRMLFNEAPTGMAIQDFSAVETFVRQLADQGVTELRSYCKAHPEAVSRLADQVVVVKANQAIVDLYGASDKQMVLGPLSRFLKVDDRQHFIDQVVTLAGGADHYIDEARNLDFQGQTLHLIIRKVVVRRSENGLSKVLTSLVDVTPIRTAERERELLMLQLQQAQKMEAIGTLAGGVAHDFNNILGIILGNVDLAVADMPEDDPVSQNLREIESAVLRARDIVKQLLGISRESRQVLTFMHLVPVVEEAIKFLRATIPANIDIQTALSIDDDVICADSTQIQQVMINLCTNASHAMEDRGGQLSVRGENVTLTDMLPGVLKPIAPGRYVCLTVCDTGMGIDETIKDKIFDPYFSTKETGKGTGMGLCMVQGIMKNCGGGIVLDTTPGEGTCFALYFPLADMPADAVIEKTLEIASGSEHILFVDDEALIVDLSEKMLKRLGYQVTIFTDVFKALALFEADPSAFDLVITDMAMPGLTGCQFVERLRQMAPTLPVILCSGYIERVAEQELETLSITKVLAKPVGLKELATAVRQTLDMQR